MTQRVVASAERGRVHLAFPARCRTAGLRLALDLREQRQRHRGVIAHDAVHAHALQIADRDRIVHGPYRQRDLLAPGLHAQRGRAGKQVEHQVVAAELAGNGERVVADAHIATRHARHEFSCVAKKFPVSGGHDDFGRDTQLRDQRAQTQGRGAHLLRGTAFLDFDLPGFGTWQCAQHFAQPRYTLAPWPGRGAAACIHAFRAGRC